MRRSGATSSGSSASPPLDQGLIRAAGTESARAGEHLSSQRMIRGSSFGAESCPQPYHQGATARRGAADALKLLSRSGHCGHGPTCYWLESVANDPEPTLVRASCLTRVASKGHQQNSKCNNCHNVE